ncbi:MAG: hypothetical protein H6702_11125 [Myxococcales bacterium]|nr:hypothetical protein [Myxococcales bacterium]
MPKRPQSAWPVQPACPEALAERLTERYGQEARVALRRLRWGGAIDPKRYRATDAALDRAGLPARLQISLLGEADTPM